MMWRQSLILKGTKGAVVGEFVSPAIFAVVLWLLATKAFYCEDGDRACFASRSFFIPYVILFTIPQGCAVNARFIIEHMVEDKCKKVRETLRLMSLSRFSYAAAIFIFQFAFAILQGTILSIGFWGSDVWWPNNTGTTSILAWLVVVFMYTG
jgi:hypothetical protein